MCVLTGIKACVSLFSLPSLSLSCAELLLKSYFGCVLICSQRICHSSKYTQSNFIDTVIIVLRLITKCGLFPLSLSAKRCKSVDAVHAFLTLLDIPAQRGGLC